MHDSKRGQSCDRCLYAWPLSAGEELDQEAFFDLLLQEATDWLPPDGIGCPQDVESLCDRAEAVCAALNLLRFLLIRDSSMASNSGRVSI